MELVHSPHKDRVLHYGIMAQPPIHPQTKHQSGAAHLSLSTRYATMCYLPARPPSAHTVNTPQRQMHLGFGDGRKGAPFRM